MRRPVIFFSSAKMKAFSHNIRSKSRRPHRPWGHKCYFLGCLSAFPPPRSRRAVSSRLLTRAPPQALAVARVEPLPIITQGHLVVSRRWRIPLAVDEQDNNLKCLISRVVHHSCPWYAFQSRDDGGGRSL